MPETDELPRRARLDQNYPNPFNPVTVISYVLDKSGYVRLEVFDLLGRRVAVLADNQMPAGRHRATFNGSGLSSGVYLYRLSAGGYVETRKMVLVK